VTEQKHPEYQYLDLLQEILDHGFRKVDQGTGDASYSVFGKQIRFKLADGFPLLTTKKVFWKGTEHWDELLKERAATSGRLILSKYSKEFIQHFKSKVKTG